MHPHPPRGCPGKQMCQWPRQSLPKLTWRPVPWWTWLPIILLACSSMVGKRISKQQHNSFALQAKGAPIFLWRYARKGNDWKVPQNHQKHSKTNPNHPFLFLPNSWDRWRSLQFRQCRRFRQLPKRPVKVWPVASFATVRSIVEPSDEIKADPFERPPKMYENMKDVWRYIWKIQYEYWSLWVEFACSAPSQSSISGENM